jgi:DNA-binding IclR family transcriptional regulator
VTIDLHVERTSSDRVFELLDALASLGPGPHRLQDVAAHAKLGASTAHRILQAGIRAGRVSKAQRGQYLLTSPHEARAAAPPPPPPPEPVIPAGQPLAVSRRIRLGLAALQKATDQPVLLYVPLILDTPMRYCLAYLAPQRDELLSDAERLLAADMVFCAPLTVDAPGRLIMAHMAPQRSSERARAIVGAGYTYGPSPVAGWHTLAAPLRRFGQIAGVICITARASWMGLYRRHSLERLLSLARELGDELPAGKGRS